MSEDKDVVAEGKLINRDPFCTVMMQNVEMNGHATDKNVVMMEDEKGGIRPVPGLGAVHSADYTLVPNRQVYDMVSDILTRSKRTFQPIPSFGSGHSKPIHWDGKRFSAKWYTDVGVDGPSGHGIAMGIEAVNSYDGSQPVGIRFFAMHVLCANQFYFQNMLGGFMFRHITREAGINLGENVNDTLGILSQQAGRFIQLAPMFKELKKKELGSLDNFLQIRQAANKEFWQASRDPLLLDELNGEGVTKTLGIPQIRDEGLNMWSLLNAYTAVSTHKIGGFTGSSLSDRATQFVMARAEVKMPAAA